MQNKKISSVISSAHKKLATLSIMRKRFGTKSVIHVLISRLISRIVVVQNYKCLLLDPARIVHLQSAGRPDITIREVLHDELSRYVSNGAYELTASFLTKMQSRHEKCYGAFCGQTLVSYSFFATHTTAINRYFRFHFPSNLCYVYKALTLPDWRGKWLNSMILSVATRSLREREIGTQGFVTVIQSCNFSSLKSFERSGFVEFVNYRVLGVARWRTVLGAGRGRARGCSIARITDRAAVPDQHVASR